MQRIPLTRGYVALVDDHRFEELNQFNWYASGRQGNVYAVRRTRDDERRMVYMHHDVLRVDGRTLYPNRADHEDRNRLNNQEYNLVVKTPSENNFNSDFADKGRGVGHDWRHGTWKAYTKGSPRKNLGTFKTEVEALEAVRQHYAGVE